MSHMMPTSRPGWALALALSLGWLGSHPGASAAPQKPAGKAAAKDPFALPVTRFQLPSGMTVLLHRDTTLPQVVVSLWFDVGSRDERPGRTGFAHLYEHLMFMGTTNVPNGGFDQIMEAEGGFNNATTSTDRTFYYDVGPAHLLGTLLWLEAERLTALPSAMTDQKVGLQREVVRNERRQSYENRPYGRAELLINESLYPKGHPYSWPVIGSHADLMAASTEDVKQFFYKYYVPSNATLTIAGDFDPAEARKLVDRYFAWMPKVPRPAPPPRPAPLQAPVQTRVTISDQVELARVYLVWHAPPAASDAYGETQLLADVLGHGKSSRLYRALVRDQQLASTVDVGIDPQSFGSMLIAELTARPGVKAEALVQAAQAELARLVKDPISEDELVRARNGRLTEWAREIETLLGRSQVLQQGLALRGDPQALRGLVAHLRALKPGALLARAQDLRLAEASARLTLTVLPAAKGPEKSGEKPGEKSGDKAPTTQAPPAKDPPAPLVAVKGAAIPEAAPATTLAARAPAYLNAAPPMLPLRPFQAPKAARFRVGELDVVLVQRRGAALLEAAVVLRDGAGSVPAEKAGLPQAVASLITEGAGERDAAAMADALERLGAILHSQVATDQSLVTLSVMAERYAEAAPLLYDVLARPRLSAADWQRVQAERLAEVVKAHAEPRPAAERAVMAALFGERHPYGLSPLGLQTTLKGLTLADLKAYHGGAYQPQRATLVLAGDVELDQATASRLAAPLSAWRGAGGKEAEAAPPPPRAVAPRLVLVDRPGAPQSEVRVVAPGLDRRSPQRPAAEVANLILGGSFTSRLNQNLRERNGYSYGAASRLVRLSGAGLFSAGAAVRTDVTGESVREILSELTRLRGEAVSAADLIKGKKSLQQRLVSQCERPEGLAQVFADLARSGLPLDELSRLLTAAQASTSASLQQVVGPLLDPQRLTVVVVGDLKKVEAAVRKQVGPTAAVEYRDSDGQPLPRPAPAR